MTVEYEVTSQRSKKEIFSTTIKPGASYCIGKHLGPSGCLVSCSRDDTHGEYRPDGESSFLKFCLFDEDAETEEELDPGKSYHFSGSKILRIYSKFHDEMIEAYHASDEDSGTRIDTTEEVKTPKELVLV